MFTLKVRSHSSSDIKQEARGLGIEIGDAATVAGIAYSAYQRYRAGQLPDGGASTVETSRPALDHTRSAGALPDGDAIDLKPLQNAHVLPGPMTSPRPKASALNLSVP